jgi:hypothetical protein
MTKSACLPKPLPAGRQVGEGRRWAKRFSIRAKCFQGPANLGKDFCELGQSLITETVLALHQIPLQRKFAEAQEIANTDEPGEHGQTHAASNLQGRAIATVLLIRAKASSATSRAIAWLTMGSGYVRPSSTPAARKISGGAACG